MKKAIFLILIFLLLLAGCNLPRSSETSHPEPTTTLTPQVSATPQPSPTPTPTPLPAVRIEQGDQAILQGDYQQAVEQYQAAEVTAPDAETRAAALLGTGQALSTDGNCPDAIPVLEKLISEYGQTTSAAPASYWLAECYQLGGAYRQAAALYENYIRLRPGVLDALMWERRGTALQAAGDRLDAIAAYQAAVDASPNGDTASLQIRIGQNYMALSDYQNAIRTFVSLHEATSNEYIKASTNLLAGQAYMALGLTDQAFTRYQDSVNNYPRAYDSYTALVELVNAGQLVDELNRGLVDYFAGMHGPAIEAFTRYLEVGGEDGGTALYYRAQSQRANGQPAAAVEDWKELIQAYPNHRYFAAAWEDIADTLWYHLDDYAGGAQTLLDYVALYPGSDVSPNYLYQAGRILERGGYLTQAADTWERIINEYPSSEDAYPALFQGGITHYRLGNYDRALVIFQRLLVLAGSGEDQARAYLWVGKTQLARGDTASARVAWNEAVQRDPTGYYSERANDLLNEKEPFTPPTVYDLAYDLEKEKSLAEVWLRATFSFSQDTDLSGLGELSTNPRYIRGQALWELGLYESARNEFEALRLEWRNDPIVTYRLMNDLLDRGIYRSAILACRQILTLAGLDDAGSTRVPAYFNHIRFGVYYPGIVIPAAQVEGLHPLLLLSVIRQESLFEGFAESTAGARGPMQIMPATGQEIANSMSWPVGYTSADLYRPSINIPLGARYLSRQIIYFNQEIYTALAAYNGGPGNAAVWRELSGSDPDLFLETIRYEETRTYIKHIFENFKIYAEIYERNP
ncbi:MAG TPA: tetratricopeptide repeat protein [Anaerolineaceae bacterium]|nr:tetratricopeptide repeat protein [Anaerolineaceae bacterium]